MATAWTKYEYKSPMAIDADTMGKVLTLKQQKYDANVAKVSELVSQFTNMNFIRDIDEEYLGKRLNKIVDYVNDMGAKDFASENVTRNITSYISSALDENVMAAIQSTQALQNQQAMIEKIKAEDPGKYNVANEWLAKQDLNRYANSGELGDVYRAQAYIPYVDINEKIIKNADVIEKFAKDIQVQYTDSGNPYFLNKITRETLSAEEARPWIERLIGDDGKQQLSINAMYKAQALDDSQVVEQYKGFIDGKISQNKAQIDSIKGTMKGMNTIQQKIAQKNINNLEEVNKQLSSYKLKDTDRVSMLASMETENVITGYSNMFAYDRVTDREIDDTPFKLHKFNVETQLAQERLNFERVQAAINNNFKELDYQLKLNTAIARGEVDAEGNPLDPQTLGINQKPDTGDNGEKEDTDTAKLLENSINARKALARELEKNYNITSEQALEEAAQVMSEPGGQKWQKYYQTAKTEELRNALSIAKTAGENGRFALEEVGNVVNMIGLYSEVIAGSSKHGRLRYIPEDVWEKARKSGYHTLGTKSKDIFDMGVILSGLHGDNIGFSKDEKEALRMAKVHLMAKNDWTSEQVDEMFDRMNTTDALTAWVSAGYRAVGNRLSALYNYVIEGDVEAAKENWRDAGRARSEGKKGRRVILGDLYHAFRPDSYMDESDAMDMSGDLLTEERNEYVSNRLAPDGSKIPSPIGKDINTFMETEWSLSSRIRTVKDNTASYTPLGVAATVDFSTKTGKNILSSVMPFIPGEVDVKRAGEFKLQEDGSMQARVFIKDQEEVHVATIPAISTPRALTKFMEHNAPTGHFDIEHSNPVKLTWSNIGLFEDEAERAEAFNDLNTQEQAKYQSYQDFGKTVDEMKQVVKKQIYDNYEVTDEFKKKADEIISHIYHVETAKSNMGGQAQFVMTYRDNSGQVLGQVPLGVTNLEKYVSPQTAPTDYRIVEEIIATRIQNELKKEL